MRNINIKELLKNRKTLYLTLTIILISVLSLTVVYAALSTVLNITGSSQITASNWDIHLANPSVSSGSVNNNLPTINGNNLSFNATLSLPGDYYEFTVDVVNSGSIDAMIDSVIKTPELTIEQTKYIKYEVSYANGESISTKQTIKKRMSTPIKVRVEYRNDLTASDLPSTETNLSLKLTLVYIQSDGTGSSITHNGKLPAEVKVVSGDYDTIGSEICIDAECFYVISSTNDTVTMFAKYNLYVGNIVDSERNITPLTNATGVQSPNANGPFYDSTGKTSTEFPLYGLTSFSSDSQKGINYSDYSGSLVEGYVNDYKEILETNMEIIEARIISTEELEELGCSGTVCLSAPTWVSATSFWTNTKQDETKIYIHYKGLPFAYSGEYSESLFGVRPVITISKDYF